MSNSVLSPNLKMVVKSKKSGNKKAAGGAIKNKAGNLKEKVADKVKKRGGGSAVERSASLGVS